MSVTDQYVSNFLDLRALAALEYMRFGTRQRIEGNYSGRHTSRQQGGAGEFVDYREYAEGEDLRRLDWKVLARSGRAYVRLFQDETNLLATLAIDVSNSMQFGSRWGRGGRGSKLEYVQYLATALSYVIARGQDQVGLAVVANRLLDAIPPGGTPRHVARVQRLIEGLRTVATTRMAPALRELFDRSSRRGVLVLFSDFLFEDLEEVFAAVRLFRQRQWEVLAMHVVHPDEERLPDGPAYRFDGLENEGMLACSPVEIRAFYQKRFEAHCAAVRSLALAVGCDYRPLSTALDYMQALRGCLVDRNG